MARPPAPTLEIVVTKSDNTLTLTETIGTSRTVLLTARVVSGCEDAGTPVGSYNGGKWIKDKTNPAHGPTPWSKDPWRNPYGPYFLPLNDGKTGKYTTYGIHGTRGPRIGNFEKPPLPEGILRFFIGDDNATKYLYCSHGCVRLSNHNISALYDITVQSKYVGVVISVIIK